MPIVPILRPSPAPELRPDSTAVGTLPPRTLPAGQPDRESPPPAQETVPVKRSTWWETIARNPLLWGAAFTLGYYAMLHGGMLAAALGEPLAAFLIRYTASHSVEYVEVFLFFVGMAALFGKLQDLAGETAPLGKELLPQEQPQAPVREQAAELLARTKKLPPAWQSTRLVQRVARALGYLARTGNVEELDQYLNQLDDQDRQEAQESLALVRIVVWAVPILGFLGTVVGITLAIANLDPKALESSLGTVVGGLGVAFDTTALALALSMVLMFSMFVVGRIEHRLLQRVDRQTRRVLLERFDSSGWGSDPRLAAVRRMSEAVIAHSQKLVEEQAQLWQQALQQVQQAGAETARQVAEQTGASLGQVMENQSHRLEQLTRAHAETLAAAVRPLTEALLRQQELTQQQWQQWEQQSARLQQILDAVAQIHSLEQTLQQNLAAVSGAHNFEQTLEQLAAVIHLLNTRVAQLPLQQALSPSASERAA